MTRELVPARFLVFSRPRLRPAFLLIAVLLALAASASSGFAQAAGATPDSDFGQYVAAHQDDLSDFFSAHSNELIREAVPVLLGLFGWIALLTMLAGWVVDLGLGRLFAFLYAPAFADWKRAVIYASGQLVLTFLYTALMSLAVVILNGFPYAGVFIIIVLLLLVLVAVAAQIVWILYLYRANLGISLVFYFAVLASYLVIGLIIAQSILSARASTEMTNYIDHSITPRLQTEALATRKQLEDVTTGRDSAQTRVADCQAQIQKAQAVQKELAAEIEAKKTSDIFTFSEIIKARARGELESAREQLAAFPAKFPNSLLIPLARGQLNAVEDQIIANEAQRKQEAAAATQAAADARAALLARAAQGQATLSEMRQALLGKSRAQVSDFLGQPSEMVSNAWNYGHVMVVNPLTGEHTGLTVYFSEGAVQSVDYFRGNP
jgi:hypothetical protein